MLKPMLKSHDYDIKLELRDYNIESRLRDYGITIRFFIRHKPYWTYSYIYW